MLAVTVDASALDDARSTAGIGRYVRCLVDNLAAVDGIRVSVARPRRPPAREAGVVRWASAQPAVLGTAVRYRAALVHATATDPAAFWPLRRQVVTVHDVVPWTSGPRPSRAVARGYLAWQRGRFRRCAGIIAVSEAVAAEAVAVLQLDESRVSVVPEGLAPAFRPTARPDDDALRRAAGVETAGYVLWTGSLVAPDPRKALGVLLEAVASLCATSPGMRLVMAGKRGDAARDVEAQAARLGVPVLLTDFVPDETLAALIRGAGVAVIPSLHEGFGLPALEAMASGTPLVASRAGNLPGLVGEAGVLVPAGDARALAQALQAVLDDAGVAARMRAAGPVQAAPYSWRRTAELTAAVYHRAAN